MRSHPLDHPNADIGCQWLCMTAGQRTQADIQAIDRITRELPFRGSPLPANLFPSNSEILALVD